MFTCLKVFKPFYVYGVGECSNFIDLHVAVQLSQHHLLKRIFFFSIVYSCLFYHRLIDHRCMGLFLVYLVALIGKSVLFVLIIVALQYCLKSRRGCTSKFVLFSQNCLSNSGCFVVPYQFQDYATSVKSIMGILIGNTLNLDFFG